jgi:hypothetical protein
VRLIWREIKMAANELSLERTAIARTLAAVALVLVLLSVGGQISRYFLGHDHLMGAIVLFHLDQEQNIPSFFSTLLLLIAALLLTVIAIFATKQKQSDASRWIVLAVGFLFMAYDEAFSVHEQLILTVRTLLGNWSHGLFYFAWVVPAVVLVACCGIFFAGFLSRLAKQVRFELLLSGTIYLSGAIGMEMVGGAYAEANGMDNFAYTMLTTIEESLEMVGVIFFIYALLGYLALVYKEVGFQLVAAPQRSILTRSVGGLSTKVTRGYSSTAARPQPGADAPVDASIKIADIARHGTGTSMP